MSYLFKPQFNILCAARYDIFLAVNRCLATHRDEKWTRYFYTDILCLLKKIQRNSLEVLVGRFCHCLTQTS